MRSNSLRGGAVPVVQDMPDTDCLSPDRVQCRSQENPEPLLPDLPGKKPGKDTSKLTAQAGMVHLVSACFQEKTKKEKKEKKSHEKKKKKEKREKKDH